MTRCATRLLRDREAAQRLHAARRRFDLSTIALRKAALDHVDRQHCVGAVLRATLERLAPLCNASL